MDFHAVHWALVKRLNGCVMLTDLEQNELYASDSVAYQAAAAYAAGDIDYANALAGRHRMNYDERRAYFLQKLTITEQVKLFKMASEKTNPEFDDASFGF